MAKNITVIMPPDNPMSAAKIHSCASVMNRQRDEGHGVEEHRQTEQTLHRPAKRQPSAAELTDERDERRRRQKRVIGLLVEPALGEDGFVEEPQPEDTRPKSDVAPANTQNAGVRSASDRRQARHDCWVEAVEPASPLAPA